MTFLDTDIFIRALVTDQSAKSAQCARLFMALELGTEQATTSEAVICEVAFVLGGRGANGYGLSPAEIAEKLRPMLLLRGLKLSQRSIWLRALDLFADYPFLDFEDALSAAHVEASKLQSITSYDTHFDRLDRMRRVEPSDPVPLAA